ncbi:hypothetical protein BH23GEM9_BH23GEM9_05990 [soil metagenome]
MKVRTSVMRGFALLALSSLTFAACDETTSPPPVQQVAVTVTPGSMQLQVGQTGAFVASVSGSTNTAVTWSSSNQAVATVSATGGVTAVAPGNAQIIATSAADANARAAGTVTVVAGPPPTPVTLQIVPSAAAVQVGGTVQLVGIVGGSTNQAVTWVSRSTGVATVNATTGLVTGVAAGTAVIEGRPAANTAVIQTAVITVTAGPQPPARTISITPVSATTGIGDSVRFVATVQGGAAGTSTAVTWRSQDPNVATVNANGFARGVAQGTAVITAISVADTMVRVNATLVVTAATPPPPPPSISIASVLTPAGAPINPLSVAGQINVTVNVSAVPDNNVRSVALLLVGAGGTSVEVCRQDFTPALGTTQSVATINCPINTAAIDAMGRAIFLNGNYTLRAVARDAVGGAGNEVASATFCPQGQVTACVLTFMNTNMMGVVLTPTGASAADPLGRIWWRSFDVTGTPTIFTPGDFSVTLTVNAYLSGQLNPVTGVITGAPLATRTVTTAPFGPTTVSFGVAQLGAIEDSVFVVAQTTTNNSLVINPIIGNPNVFSTTNQWIRIDTWAPRVNSISLPHLGYINDAFTFSLSPHCTVAALPAGCRTTDLGVDRQNEAGNITFDIVTPGAPNTPVAGGANVTNASGVAESATNMVYALRITIKDALGNQRIVWAGNAGNIVTASPSATNLRLFGVDRTPPTVTILSGPAHLSTNTGLTNWLLTYIDAATPPAGPAGFGVDPLRVRLVRYNAADPNGRCINPNTGVSVSTDINAAACFVVVTGNPGVVNIPAIDGYYVMTGYAVDAAGNQSPMVTRMTLNDFTAPFAGSLTVPTVITGGAAASFFAQVTDNVDLGDVWATIGFMGGAGNVWLVQAQQTIGAYGLPIITSDARTLVVDQFIRSVTATQPTGEAQAPASRSVATTAEFAVRDVAAMQLGDLCPAPTAGDNASTQNCHLRQASIAAAVTLGVTVANPYRDWTATGAGSLLAGPSAALPTGSQFTLGALPAAMCNGDPTQPVSGQPCPSGNPITTSIRASVTGPAQTFNNPFQRVLFYVRAGATNRAHLIGLGSISVTDNTITGIRTWTYTQNFSAMGYAPGTYDFFALGVDANGDALMTQVGQIQINND